VEHQGDVAELLDDRQNRLAGLLVYCRQEARFSTANRGTARGCDSAILVSVFSATSTLKEHLELREDHFEEHLGHRLEELLEAVRDEEHLGYHLEELLQAVRANHLEEHLGYRLEELLDLLEDCLKKLFEICEDHVVELFGDRLQELVEELREDRLRDLEDRLEELLEDRLGDLHEISGESCLSLAGVH